MKNLVESLHLLHDDDNVVRVPQLVKGKIIVPPKVSKEDIVRAFEGEKTHAYVGDAQVLREPIIDRASMQHTGEWQYQVLSRFEPLDLVERDAKELVSSLYALPFSEIVDYLDALGKHLAQNEDVLDRVKELGRKTAPHPDRFHDASFAAFPLILGSDVASATVDAELAWNGIPGRKFLDGWVDVDVDLFPGLTAMLAGELFGIEDLGKAKAQLRAMPTRQLHITAGNAPAIPVFSLLRALSTKGAAVIKSPYGAVMPGAVAALAAASMAPDHPLTKHLSLVYWPGGDRAIEDVLLSPMAFDRIVVWGAPDAVKSVQQRAEFTKTIAFNPRYGLSLIGKEAFRVGGATRGSKGGDSPPGGSLREIAMKTSIDALIWNQKACIASFVQYVEGSLEDAERFASELQKVLAEWDSFAPNYLPPAASATLRRMKRGKYMDARWHSNAQSNVVVMDGKFDMLDHPMSRTMIVRRVDRLEDVVETLHHGVASIGVYPEDRRRELRDVLLARGVSNVLPLGHVERTFGGMPHDGMRVLGDLVDWKHA